MSSFELQCTASLARNLLNTAIRLICVLAVMEEEPFAISDFLSLSCVLLFNW